MNIPLLMAHRGYVKRYPENTLPAIEAALEAGAPAIEFDLQLTADQVPVLLHDPDLARTAGVHRRITDMTLDEARTVHVNERARLGDKFNKVPIPTLAETVDVIGDWPGVVAFVEIKRGSVDVFGVDAVVRQVVDALNPIKQQCVIISFHEGALGAVREMSGSAIGWVFKGWTDASRSTAAALAPEYLLCSYTDLPPMPTALWAGPWRWAFYEVTDPELALQLAERGAEYVETMEIVEMLAHPLLGKRAMTANSKNRP